MPKAKSMLQSAGFTKETSALPCFASKAKQPYNKAKETQYDNNENAHYYKTMA